MNIYEFRVKYDDLARNYPLFIEANTLEDATKHVRDNIGIKEENITFIAFEENNNVDYIYLKCIAEYERILRQYILLNPIISI